MPKAHLSPKEAAEFLGVDETTLWRWTRLGRLPVVDLPSPNGRGRIRRYPKKDLELFIKRHRHPSIGEQATAILREDNPFPEKDKSEAKKVSIDNRGASE